MKKLYFSLLFVFLALYTYAEKVDSIKARTVAERFLESKNLLKTKSDLILVYTRKIENNTNLKNKANLGDALFVFSNKKNGFVIISGDDVLMPIIGYSNQNSFYAEDIPSGLEDLFIDYVKQIIFCRENKILQTKEVKAKWDSFLLKSSLIDPPVEYGPILKDEHGNLIQWSQGYPFNMMCPQINGQNTSVGCVNTAVVQLMRYWRHPANGTNSYSYDWNGQTLTVDFSQQNYNWDIMPAKYNNDWTEEQKNEVAKISYHIGVNNHSTFGLSGTTAYLNLDGLIENFSFDKSAQRIYRYEWENIWVKIIKQELLENRPIYYSGRCGSVGHAFICDGFNSDDYFHFNFGWNGSSDGFYLISNPLGFESSQCGLLSLYPKGFQNNSPYKTVAKIQDSIALVAFYNATNGANWTNNENWRDSELSLWNGVMVFFGKVYSIVLGGNNLVGNIPIELGSISELQYIKLASNQLSDEIPSELGNLTQLCYLDLTENNLSSEIPLEIGDLYNLQRLSLASNQLTGEIPSELGNLTQLSYLDLTENNLSSEIPLEIGDLYNLQRLSLASNQLTGEIPSEIGNLINLKDLYLNSNQLYGEIPLELKNLSNLLRLDLCNNKLTFSDLAHSGIFDGDLYKFIYSPQAKMTAPSQNEEDQNIILSIPVGHEMNSYVWYRNGAKIETVDSCQLVISDHEGGAFFCQVRNSLYPSLVLETEPLIVESTVGLYEDYFKKHINIHPNPSRDKLFIEIENSYNEQIVFEIYNNKGQLLSKFEEILFTNNHTIKINSSEFPNGLYYLKIISKKGIVNKNFMVVH